MARRIGVRLLGASLLVAALASVVTAVLGVRLVPVLTRSTTPYVPPGGH